MISLQRAFSLHDDALVLRSERASLLASNMANADTPDYKARDMDFSAALKAATSEQGSGLKLAQTQQRHLQGSNALTPAWMGYRQPFQAALDGNTVETQVEQVRFSENAMRFQASFSFLDSKIKGVISAIRGE